MPNAERKKLEKKAAAVPEGKRPQRKSTGVGCPFKINCSKVDRNNREDERVKISPSSIFKHQDSLWLMGAAGPLWWLWAWATWMAFNLLLLVLYPTFIAPLFNKFQPLDNEAV